MNPVAVEVTRLKLMGAWRSESRHLDCYGSWPQCAIRQSSRLSMNRSAGLRPGAFPHHPRAGSETGAPKARFMGSLHRQLWTRIGTMNRCGQLFAGPKIAPQQAFLSRIQAFNNGRMQWDMTSAGSGG